MTQDRIMQLVTGRGFVRVFWDELRERRAEDSTVTQRAVFDDLNDLFEETFGEPKFPSWEAFRKYRDRLQK